MSLSEMKYIGRKQKIPKPHFNLQSDELNRLPDKSDYFWFYTNIISFGIILLLVVLLYFFIEAGWQAEKKYQKELKRQQMQNSIQTAFIEVSRRDYEASRQTANDFFILLEKEYKQSDESSLTSQQKETMQSVLEKKETINELLGRKNPKAGDEIGAILEIFQKHIKAFQPDKNK